MSKFSYFVKSIFLGIILYFLFTTEVIPTFVKYMTVMSCLALLISPRIWFGLKNCGLKIKRSQVEGLPTKEKLTLLLMLFRLRYLEIYNTYARLRFMQERAGDENWILVYLKEEASYLSEVDYLSIKKDKKIKKREKQARDIFDKFFDFEKFSYDTDRIIENSTDLEIEFSFLSLTLPKLIVIRSFGYFQDELNVLIKNYQFIDYTYSKGFRDRFEDFIINRVGKEEKRTSYQCIESTWRRLFNILKVYLIYFEDHENKQDQYKLVFKEIEDLEEMTSCLSFALRKKNAQCRRSFGSPTEETERAFFERITSNPLWAKSFF